MRSGNDKAVLDNGMSRFTSELDQLQKLLEEQVKLAQQGDVNKVEAVSNKAGDLVERLAKAGVVGSAEFKSRREQLVKLYDRLALAVASQKADTAGELKHLRKGKKTIDAYRYNL